MIKARIADAGDPKDRRQTSRQPVEIDARMRELAGEQVVTKGSFVLKSEMERHKIEPTP